MPLRSAPSPRLRSSLALRPSAIRSGPSTAPSQGRFLTYASFETERVSACGLFLDASVAVKWFLDDEEFVPGPSPL